MWYSPLCPGKTSRELKSCQNIIGKELIKTRHEYPQLQSRMYALLDQVSKMYKLAISALSKKKRAKLLAMQEQGFAAELRKDNKKLDKELRSLKARFAQSKAELSIQVKKVAQLTEQRADIVKKITHLEALEKTKRSQSDNLLSTDENVSHKVVSIS